MYKLAIKVKWIKVNKRWESKTRRRASMQTISDLERESELGKVKVNVKWEKRECRRLIVIVHNR